MAPLHIAISLHKLREHLSCMPFKPKPMIAFLFPAAALLPVSFSINFLRSDLPSRVLAFFSHMLIPPYLFLLVNCIIITIAVTSAPQGEEWERFDVARGRLWAESGDGSGGGVGRRQREGRGGVDEACRRKSSSGKEKEEEEEEGTSVHERARNEGVDYDDEEQEDEWKDMKSLPPPHRPLPLPSKELFPSSRCDQEEEEDPCSSKQQRAGGDGMDDDEEDEGWKGVRPFPLPPPRPPSPPISPSCSHRSVEGSMSDGRGMTAMPPPLSLRCSHRNGRAMKNESTHLPAPPPPLELLPCWRSCREKTAMWASSPPNPGPSALLKSMSFHAHHPHSPPHRHREGMGMSVDELNIKVEAFIAKFNLHIRLQNHA